jgi:hypothetical protein
MNLFDVLLENLGILFMTERQSRHGDELGFLFRVGVMNQMQNMGDGIANDLAFGPAECDGQSL